jgi:hypothetical protein
VTKGNLKLLDMDEHLRPTFEVLHKECLAFCKTHGIIMDLATSDVVIYFDGVPETFLGDQIAYCNTGK